MIETCFKCVKTIICDLGVVPWSLGSLGRLCSLHCRKTGNCGAHAFVIETPGRIVSFSIEVQFETPVGSSFESSGALNSDIYVCRTCWLVSC